MKAGLQRVPSLMKGLAGRQIRRSGNRHGCEYQRGRGPDAENGDTGQFVRGNAVRTTINKNGRQIVAAEGTANTTVVYAGGDQTVHGHALDTTLNGGTSMCTTAVQRLALL